MQKGRLDALVPSRRLVRYLQTPGSLGAIRTARILGGRMRTRTLSSPRENPCNAMLTTMRRGTKREIRAGDIQPSWFDPSTLPLCRAVTQTLLEAAAATARARVQGPFPMETGDAGAVASLQLERHTVSLLSAGSSTGAKRGGRAMRAERSI